MKYSSPKLKEPLLESKFRERLPKKNKTDLIGTMIFDFQKRKRLKIPSLDFKFSKSEIVKKCICNIRNRKMHQSN